MRVICLKSLVKGENGNWTAIAGLVDPRECRCCGPIRTREIKPVDLGTVAEKFDTIELTVPERFERMHRWDNKTASYVATHEATRRCRWCENEIC